ncbi:MAG: TRAM domain-containing protein [Clostridia bacterium]|nr:TRAM domain-containing protein [Clostridia bacterium]
MEHTVFSGFSKQGWSFIGAFFGAALAALLMQPLRLLPLGWGAGLAALVLYGCLMLIGARTAKQYAASVRLNSAVAQTAPEACPKVLDTSVIIDGRVFDICKAGFLEGELVIPAFVLDELRHIADSADSLRRARGRRGLDILQKIREELDCPVRIEEEEDTDEAEVDVKLLRLAKRLNGAVMTNDYNLNKVAGVAKVPVLNINELAGALRPVVLPGEEMTVRIVRDGKEPGQGVAYLDDGTMVVVENGRRRVGDTLDVEVTTVLQTSAGRMIFTRIKTPEPKAI